MIHVSSNIYTKSTLKFGMKPPQSEQFLNITADLRNLLIRN